MSDDDDCIIIEDNLNYKSISCENIPELFLDKLTAKKHFSRFGRINRFILRPKRLQCTVEYEKVEDAENAYLNAGVYNGQHFVVKYTTNEVAHTRNTEEWVDPDVQAELDAMGHSIRPVGRGVFGGVIRHSPAVATAASAAVSTGISPRAPKPILKNTKPLEAFSGRGGDTNMKNELEAILRKQAIDLEDRYRILDARDKLIRLTTVRTTDIKKAVSTKGICPDMCPEKERLLREAKHQVSSFELDDGNRNVMDHKIAIKEYSRSSADQEAPLAHELRPESVLKMTMNYLMHKIMDLCDDPGVNIGDWYHFVWDRTRSIRKDITQQELCSLETVQLVEQCARFHIHCAARLISEDPAVFDQKINTENLTKCLQTLKYMYHDLRLKNTKCPNEGEFRAYVVLLNLSDSNFLWEIKQLPVELQNCEEIQFALMTYLAMESNNYVKFFKLVRKTNYLNACILLRYFTQVRIKAIQTIMKAYNWPRHLVSLPLNYLKEIFAFECEESTVEWFNYYGLDCDMEKVYLDKNSFYIPDVPCLMDRSLTVVEIKRQVSVGEIVCGKKLESLDAFNNHVPHSSFDEDGCLRQEAWNAEDQIPGAHKKPSTTAIKDIAETNLFKIPKSSPPISPKPFNKSIFNLKPPQEGKTPSIFSIQSTPSISTKPPQPAISFTSFPPSSSVSKNGIFGSAFAPVTKPQEKDTSLASKTENSIFSISAFNKSTANEQLSQKSIFGGTQKTTSSASVSFVDGTNNISKTGDKLIESSFKSDNIFKHFGAEPFITKEEGVELLPSATSEISEPPKDDEKLQQKEEKLKREKEEKEKLALKEKKRHEEIQKEQKRKQEILRKEKLKQIEKNSELHLQELISLLLKEVIKEISLEELEKYKQLISNCESLMNQLIEECLSEELTEVIDHEILIISRKQKLIQKYFIIWRHNVLLKKERRRLIESTPVWLEKDSTEEGAYSLVHPYQNETLQMMTRYRLGVPKRFDLSSHKLEPIDILSLLLPVIRDKKESNERGILKSRKYLKIVLSIPLETEEVEGFNSYINFWLTKNIARTDKSDSKGFFCETRENLSLCIRKISGVIYRNENDVKVSTECDNLNAAILIMTCGNFIDSRRRLHHLLKLSQVYKPIPLAIIVYNSTVDEEFIRNELELEKLKEDEKISKFAIYGIYGRIRDEDLRNAFEEALIFVARNYNDNYDLEMQLLPSFINLTLGTEFWNRLHQSWMINPSFRKLATQPQQIIEIYNEAIDRIIIILDEDYDQSPEFPQELREFVPDIQCDIPLDLEYFPKDWKIDERNFRIKRFLKKIKLKLFKLSLPKTDIPQIETALLNYSEELIPLDKSLSKKAGYSAIKVLLEKINSPDLLDLTIVDKMNFISWLSILQPIALCVLQFNWDSDYKYLPREVIYKKLPLTNFVNTPWWLESDTVKTIKMIPSMDEEDESFLEEPHQKKPKREEDDKDQSLDEILAKGFALVEKADRNLEMFRHITTVGREITRSFDINLYQQEMAVRSMKRFIRENV